MRISRATAKSWALISFRPAASAYSCASVINSVATRRACSMRQTMAWGVTSDRWYPPAWDKARSTRAICSGKTLLGMCVWGVLDDADAVGGGGSSKTSSIRYHSGSDLRCCASKRCCAKSIRAVAASARMSSAACAA